MKELSEHRIRTDLSWIIDGPPLLHETTCYDQTGIESFEFPQSLSISAVDVRGPAFTEGFQRTHRVGDYFEQLVVGALEQLPEFEILAKHRQVFEGKKTLGEVDCIFRDQTGRVTHLEVSVKFFLLNQNAKSAAPIDLEEFVGPNPRDNFRSKLDHMVKRQLQLGAKTGFEIERKLILVRGVLFYPASVDANDLRLPELIHRRHLRGTWCRASEISMHLGSLEPCRFGITPKPFWLGDYKTPKDRMVGPSEFENVVKRHFREGLTAVHFHSRTDDGSLGRHFVVSDDWPSLGEADR